jgi:SAM-dependent methyltransferase
VAREGRLDPRGVSFAVPADAYDRFMGRYSTRLAPLFADFAELEDVNAVLDVGCGPGALTSELAARLGAAAVTAVDPSESFVEAVQSRNPDVDVRQASAEALPFGDGAFDRALAQLVVHFMADPVEGLREMRRVTRDGGLAAACVWDHAGGTGPLSPFWDAVHSTDPAAPDESGLAGSRQGHLTDLFHAAGFGDVEEIPLTVSVEHESFDEWWEPYTFGVGPAGGYVRSVSDSDRATLRERCRAVLGDGPFVVDARAWSARARV